MKRLTDTQITAIQRLSVSNDFQALLTWLRESREDLSHTIALPSVDNLPHLAGQLWAIGQVLVEIQQALQQRN